MTHPANTRSARRNDHLLQTPDTFIRAPLPGMRNATAVVHAAPAIGAGFVQYTAEMQEDGVLGPAAAQRFVYVIEGDIEIEFDDHRTRLEQGGYAYLPQGAPHAVRALSASRVLMIEKEYQPIHEHAPPPCIAGNVRDVALQALLGDADLQVQTLIPDDPAFDFAINILTFQPGAALPLVETHVMEHGLMMLAGQGIYRLNDCWYAVSEGDFIWMGPFCPQWFAAIGKTPAKYILYKDWNRNPLG